MLTKEQALARLRSLTPADRVKVVVMAQTIRAARDAGDIRPPGEIVAPILALTRRMEH